MSTGWVVVDDYVRARGLATRARTPGQTIAGTHASGSYHYLGQAVDYGRSDSDADAIARLLLPLATGPGAPIVELFGSDGTSMKNGAPLSPEPEGHRGSHTHAAIRAGVTTLDGWSPAVATSSPVLLSTAGAGEIDPVAALGRPGTALRLVEVAAGAILILMGLVALSNTLKGAPPWPTIPT